MSQAENPCGGQVVIEARGLIEIDAVEITYVIRGRGRDALSVREFLRVDTCNLPRASSSSSSLSDATIAMSNANDHISPRVNSARLKDFVNASHPVRMTGKVLNVRPKSPPLEPVCLCFSSPSQPVFQRRNVLYYGGP
jgi:hypothetical protein